MTEQEKCNLERFRHYITMILTPRHVLSYMATWLEEDTIEQIKAEEQRGTTLAATMFLDCLLHLEKDGWFRGFLDGLYAAGYKGLRKAIENWDFGKIERLEEYRTRLRTTEPILKNEIKPEDFVDHLEGYIMKSDREEILQLTRNKGQIAGAEKLIDCLFRSDKEEWPKTFRFALEEANYGNALELWTLESGSEKQSDEVDDDDRMDEDTSAFNMFQYSEEPGKESCCWSPNPTVLSDGAMSMSVDVSGVLSDVNGVQLRKYQIELAQAALSGKNTIVCAPTGSGKTIVSLTICEHHLKSLPKGKGKVVFLATKVPVYEQQKEVFKRHFENSEYTVAGISGETHETARSAIIFESHDIILLTPQILVNRLEDGSIKSLSLFTMIIFDECHNTTKNHPYSVLMSKYLDMKLGTCQTDLPQIIGLTASVGVGKPKNGQEAMEYICKLCAILDVQVISTVRENIDELKSFVFTPQKFIRQVVRRQKDDFSEIICKMMKETEEMAKGVFPSLDTLSNIQNRTFGTQKYEQWIVDTQKKCRLLQMADKAQESFICRTLFTYTEHLRKYNDALMINEDARTKDALGYLQVFFSNMRNGGFDDTERKLAEQFEARESKLSIFSEDDVNENPKLEDLTAILLNEYRLTPQTRTLLFVKTRALATALKNWIEESDALCFLKPDILIGRGKRDEGTGMTLPSQKGVLDSFKSNSECKILIATSVADEGIDIAQCNLVLLYEYVGNVIKMIQVRGRGRAKDSKCFLVTSKSDQADKEKINIEHEKMMTKALEELQLLDQKVFLQKMSTLQHLEKNARDSRRLAVRPRLEYSDKKLLCGKCKGFACYTKDIRTIQKAHHAVFDSTFEQRYITKPHDKPKSFEGVQKKCKLFCNGPKCLHDWGITANYMTFQNIPLIKIDSFVVEDLDTRQQRYFTKWIDVNFTMKEFDLSEFTETTQNHKE